MFDRLRAMFTGKTPGSAQGGPAMISCEDALRRVHEFIDGEMDSQSAAEVEEHFAVCQQCYPHLQLEKAFRDAVRRAASGDAAPPELRDKVLALLEEARSEG